MEPFFLVKTKRRILTLLGIKKKTKKSVAGSVKAVLRVPGGRGGGGGIHGAFSTPEDLTLYFHQGMPSP